MFENMRKRVRQSVTIPRESGFWQLGVIGMGAYGLEMGYRVSKG